MEPDDIGSYVRRNQSTHKTVTVHVRIVEMDPNLLLPDRYQTGSLFSDIKGYKSCRRVVAAV